MNGLTTDGDQISSSPISTINTFLCNDAIQINPLNRICLQLRSSKRQILPGVPCPAVSLHRKIASDSGQSLLTDVEAGDSLLIAGVSLAKAIDGAWERSYLMSL